MFYYPSFDFIFLKKEFLTKSLVTDFGMLQYDEIYPVILFEHVIFYTTIDFLKRI